MKRKQEDIRDAIKNRPIKWIKMSVNYDVNNGESPITIEETKQAIGREIKQPVSKSLRGLSMKNITRVKITDKTKKVIFIFSADVKIIAGEDL